MKTIDQVLEKHCPVFGNLFMDKQNMAMVSMRESIVNAMDEYAKLSEDTLKCEIETLRGQIVDRDLDMQTAVQLLNAYAFGNNVHNEAVNFCQKYFNEQNIFPYEP
jgi:hypothetical protein